MNDEDKESALESIRMSVRSGFYGADEIEQIVEDMAEDPDGIDRDWVRAQIQEAMQQKRREEAEWPAETDCDRLDQMFEALNSDGIVALQNAGYTQSDGVSDVSEAYREAGGKQSGIQGYCFYHGQDLERAIEGGELWLTFGDIDGDDDKGTQIGQRVQRAAIDAGFTVEWNGSVKKRVLLKGLRWQRRSPRQD